jgi:hypothetical protein
MHLGSAVHAGATVQVVPRLLGGGRRGRQTEADKEPAAGDGTVGTAAPEGKEKVPKTRTTTISGLGAKAHFGCDDLGAEWADAAVEEVEHIVQSARVELLMASSWGPLYIQRAKANDFRHFDLRFIGESLRSDQEAGNWGTGLFNVLTGNTRSGSKNLLPEQQDVAKEVRKLFLESVDAEVEQLRKEGVAKGTHLDKALEQLDLKNLAVGRPMDNTKRGYGIAVKNHLKADWNRALKRTYTQYVEEQLALRSQTLTHKVGKS